MKGIRKVQVKVPGREYPIWIGPRTIEALKGWKGMRTATSSIVLADAALSAHTRRLVRTLKSLGQKTLVIEVKATEGFKDFQAIYPIYGKLLEQGADRDAILFAVGGGVIGDAAGFIAGTYLRGIRWVGVATTLLAQVDSSIGGKTGINHERGKNLIGAFHQPSLVICDTDVLKSLPERDIISGLGEMIKYGLIVDAPFYRELEKSWKRIGRHDASALSRAIARCARWKARVVARDERDVTGLREILNFGHTVGHALEGITGYSHYRHGEAVILGMRAAVRLSAIRGHLARSQAEQIDTLLSQLPLPPPPRSVTPRDLLPYIRRDKKSSGGNVRFVLLSKIGKTVSDQGVREEELLEAIAPILSLSTVSRR